MKRNEVGGLTKFLRVFRAVDARYFCFTAVAVANTSLSISFILAGIATASGQTQEELKKKYESSDIQEEIEKKLASDNVYPDSVIIPPLHYINTAVLLDSAIADFHSISIDIEVKNELPDSYRFYISPFNMSFNRMPFYCGIQTMSGGTSVSTQQHEDIGRGGIFSRWMERDTGALKTDGYYASSDGEGDFIGVRNKVAWGKGKYRVTLAKTGYVPDKAVPDSATRQDLIFAWGEYEHSWVTMTVEDLSTGATTTIGSLAFPGNRLRMDGAFTIFLEQYGHYIDFVKGRNLPHSMYYADLPVAHIVFDRIAVNGNVIAPKGVTTYHNRTHHPEQKKVAMPIPLLSQVVYDPASGTIDCVVGKFVAWETPSQAQ
ncbi:hypothetical protein [Parapedobacter sp. DT-150]|uniref:hypothetical protein n=1 Tax=Parapedobacter sp. DT-150 TaxID=3396162 RepID=UPI003F1A06D4